MAWPRYAQRFKENKSVLVQALCRGCNAPRFMLPSAQPWVKGQEGLTAKCLKCGHVQDDSYNWLQV